VTYSLTFPHYYNAKHHAIHELTMSPFSLVPQCWRISCTRIAIRACSLINVSFLSSCKNYRHAGHTAHTAISSYRNVSRRCHTGTGLLSLIRHGNPGDSGSDGSRSLSQGLPVPHSYHLPYQNRRGRTAGSPRRLGVDNCTCGMPYHTRSTTQVRNGI
jgi:hypothetical protein